ncbi:MAG: methyltransferase domain-containing protein [Planctomycetaceae bacterium]
MTLTERLIVSEFPRSNAYHPEWVLESVSGGANSVWLVDWLTSILDLKPGMNVLDLGCGRAASSIFLAREYGVVVWATDLWFNPSENFQRIRDADLVGSIFPIRADARTLPFATDFFDAIVSIDAFPYFGTDDHYLSYLARFVKPSGVIAVAGAGFLNEIERDIPAHLSEWLQAEPMMFCLHSPAWWRRHWERTGTVDVEIADSMPDGLNGIESSRLTIVWRLTPLKTMAVAISDTIVWSVAVDQLLSCRSRSFPYHRTMCRSRCFETVPSESNTWAEIRQGSPSPVTLRTPPAMRVRIWRCLKA